MKHRPPTATTTAKLKCIGCKNTTEGLPVPREQLFCYICGMPMTIVSVKAKLRAKAEA